MTISTNDVVNKFGTQDALGTSSASVANDGFSIASDLSTWVNDDNAPMASVLLSAIFSPAPNPNSSINLYARLLDVQGANDQDVPDANFNHIYVGSFPLNDVTTTQYVSIDISLPNAKESQNYEFYIENKTGRTLIAGWDIFVTPKTVGALA